MANWKRVSRAYYDLKPEKPYLCDFYLATYLAEKAGKRLPTDSEFRQILANVDVERPGAFEGMFSEPWEWTSTSPMSVARTSETDIFRATLRDSTLLYGGSPTKKGRIVRKIADEPAAIRAVRSARPRLRAEDFAPPEPDASLEIEDDVHDFGEPVPK